MYEKLRVSSIQCRKITPVFSTGKVVFQAIFWKKVGFLPRAYTKSVPRDRENLGTPVQICPSGAARNP